MKATLHQISTLSGCRLPAGANPDLEIDNLLTDSRSLEAPESTLFFAIPTEGNDGHRYIGDLYRKGVRVFVVNHLPEDSRNMQDAVFFVVDDTVRALQKIAARSDRFPSPILAITGSRGKTTLKEWIFQLIEPLVGVSRSPRSYNSQIGVPLSMWELDPSARLGIIEAGISRRGEMAALAECIDPDMVIITNVSDPHSEGFESDSEKAREKAKLITSTTSLAIYNKDNPLLAEAVENRTSPETRLGWSLKDKDAALYIHISEKGGNEATEARSYADAHSGAEPGERRVTYSFAGLANGVPASKGTFYADIETEADIENAANALAFMLSLGIDADTIRERFGSLHRIGTRLNVTEGVNGCSVIHDSYTSDFSSLRPALDFLRRRKMPFQTATVILSDLHHESGTINELYERVARLMESNGIDRFIGIGPTLKAHRDLFPANSTFFDNTSDFIHATGTSDFANEAILLKGSPEYDFDVIADLLETRRHETVLEVNLEAIVSNYNYFRRHLPRPTGMICMVKASGYGAGSYEIAKTLQDCGAAYLAVAVLDEGTELRRRGITMPIMVMNPKVENYGAMFADRLEPEIYSFAMLEDVIREARRHGIKDYPIHIKLDTGMHRTGFVESELPELMDILESTSEIKAKSIFSHLATADCLDMDDYTHLQLERFERYTSYMQSRSSHRLLRHILNSAGILRFPEYHYDFARLGIGLYGANTLPPEIEEPLTVVSTLRTIIISIREWEAGETIGYGRMGRLSRPSRIATIPIGYADGMNRHFGRGAVSVVVNGQEAPTVGNICMDACMIDVTDIDCRVGDPVEIFGRQAPIQRLADCLDTIPYEILTSVSPRVKRVYFRD